MFPRPAGRLAEKLRMALTGIAAVCLTGTPITDISACNVDCPERRNRPWTLGDAFQQHAHGATHPVSGSGD
jgi:hypothetical protein